MKLIKKSVRTFAAILTVLSVFLWTVIITLNSKLAQTYFVSDNQSLTLGSFVKAKSVGSIQSISPETKNARQAELSLFGLFPIKTISVKSVEQKKVVPGGIPFGIKLISNGVIVTATEQVVKNGKIVCPAKEAGLEVSDVILSINGAKTTSNDDITRAVANCGGKSLNLKVRKKNGKTDTISIKPVLDSLSGDYKIGVWVKDSSAGIGTITFFEPNTKLFGGLGHAVCDSTTGESISLLKGEVVIAEIDSVSLGKSGSPGQLNGHFATTNCTGSIVLNDQTGVYGILQNVRTDTEGVDVALKQEVKTGEATILTTLSGLKAEEFKIEIEKISYNQNRAVKNMVVRVTDPRLLKISGGIVQGMSGSPILQNGKLVGAITHVFVNDPTRGYAIFAENMLETAQSVAESNKLKDVS